MLPWDQACRALRSRQITDTRPTHEFLGGLPRFVVRELLATATAAGRTWSTGPSAVEGDVRRAGDSVAVMLALDSLSCHDVASRGSKECRKYGNP